jgi:hypothetical protein
LCGIFLINGRCLHADAGTATAATCDASYDFDPTTSAKNSAKTPPNEEGGYELSPLSRVFFGRGMNVVGANSRRAEVFWEL